MDDRGISFSAAQHMEAVVKRRIKFVVEKGAMARLFKKNTHQHLQKAVRARIDVQTLKQMASETEFDTWHREIVQDPYWAEFTVRNIDQVRWGHFAKLINIVIYELVANNEIMTYEEAERLRKLIHLPIDQKVLDLVRRLRRGIRLPRTLLDMNESEYAAIQQAIRDEARKLGIPAIWFEDAYAHDFGG